MCTGARLDLIGWGVLMDDGRFKMLFISNIICWLSSIHLRCRSCPVSYQWICVVLLAHYNINPRGAMQLRPSHAFLLCFYTQSFNPGSLRVWMCPHYTVFIFLSLQFGLFSTRIQSSRSLNGNLLKSCSRGEVFTKQKTPLYFLHLTWNDCFLPPLLLRIMSNLVAILCFLPHDFYFITTWSDIFLARRLNYC